MKKKLTFDTDNKDELEALTWAVKELNKYKDMSKSETEVSEYLDSLEIPWKYQYPIFVYDEKNRPRVWSPDFYLPDLQIHLEVWGSGKNKKSYDYRKDIYNRNDVSIIFLHTFKESYEWKTYLRKCIVEIGRERE